MHDLKIIILTKHGYFLQTKINEHKQLFTWSSVS